MYSKRFIILIPILFLSFNSFSQKKENIIDVASHSLAIYNKGDWNNLIKYGIEKIENGIDFPILRMRIGFAYFKQDNYAQSLNHYSKALELEPLNETAQYYIYLNHLYLNQVTEARYYASKMSPAVRKNLNIKEVNISEIQTEFSFKMPDDISREDALYARVGFNMNLGYRLELEQSIAMYNQIINEPKFSTVTNNNKIDIQQKEYYGKIKYSISNNLALIAGIHYLNTPFNNFSYNNLFYFGGLSYSTPYVTIKYLSNLGSNRDSNYYQQDLSFKLQPLGNSKLYTISKFSYNKKIIFTQVVGVGISKKLWLESNVTLGKYDNLIDQDGLYIYNDVDTKKFKIGASIYTSLTKNLSLSLNYNFEQKIKYKTTNNNFNQYSITGGLSWKF